MRIGQSITSFRKSWVRLKLIGRIIEANAGCYFTVDFGRLIPGLGLSNDASTLDGEGAIMNRMISSGVHIVSTRFQ